MKIAKILLSLFVFLFACTGVLVAQEVMDSAAPVIAPACDSVLCMLLKNFPEVSAWGIAIFTFLAVVLRALAELLLFISNRLKNAAAGSWAKRIGEWATWAANILSWMGAGMPKQLLLQKAQAINDKK